MNNFIIRPWRAGDETQVWEVLRNSSFSNTTPAFLLTLRNKNFMYLLSVCCLIVYWWNLTICSVFYTIIMLILGAYILSVVGTLYFLYGPNMNDMTSVKTNYFRDEDCQFWVAETKCDHPRGSEKIIGTIAVVKKRNENGCKIAWLRRMAVLKEFRGSGVAQKLVQTLIQFCKERKYIQVDLITTEVHKPARKLYTKLGFKCMAYRPYRYLKGLVQIWTYEFTFFLKN